MITGPGNVLLPPNDKDSFLDMVQKTFNLVKVEFQTRAGGSFEDRDKYSNLTYVCLAIHIQKNFGFSATGLT